VPDVAVGGWAGAEPPLGWVRGCFCGVVVLGRRTVPGCSATSCSALSRMFGRLALRLPAACSPLTRAPPAVHSCGLALHPPRAPRRLAPHLLRTPADSRRNRRALLRPPCPSPAAQPCRRAPHPRASSPTRSAPAARSRRASLCPPRALVDSRRACGALLRACLAHLAHFCLLAYTRRAFPSDHRSCRTVSGACSGFFCGVVLSRRGASAGCAGPVSVAVCVPPGLGWCDGVFPVFGSGVGR